MRVQYFVTTTELQRLLGDRGSGKDTVVECREVTLSESKHL